MCIRDSPHIGNTGINREDSESEKVWASGLIIKDLPLLASNWRKEISLTEFLVEQKITAIADIDTRRLTRLLRDKGPLNGCIISSLDDTDSVSRAIDKAREFPGLKGMDLAREVSVENSYIWEDGTWDIKDGYQPNSRQELNVVAYDFGVKRNILRMLSDRGCKVTYAKDELFKPRQIKTPADYRPGTTKGKIDAHDIWVVEVKMPKELIGNFKHGKDNIESQDETEMPGEDLNNYDAS